MRGLTDIDVELLTDAAGIPVSVDDVLANGVDTYDPFTPQEDRAMERLLREGRMALDFEVAGEQWFAITDRGRMALHLHHALQAVGGVRL